MWNTVIFKKTNNTKNTYNKAPTDIIHMVEAEIITTPPPKKKIHYLEKSAVVTNMQEGRFYIHNFVVQVQWQ